ncbi:hypothetical protein FHX42_003268 [Saccharopolyspora lacisalsi]|uniref:Uncharacterized protein n=1 Tax=Halosaccharopolyspora lacisalsi TaxID=1000566 RepID=A0A839DV99_9PSEU|nr:hypothetical protein [Halosaccharopolyspora lacisalsi]MBA8825902.1 hypothetical protein [Halosaccharopolyspora lacisalsi]
MSIEDVQQDIHKPLGTLPHDGLLRARTLLDEAATELHKVTVGSDDATLHESPARRRGDRRDQDGRTGVPRFGRPLSGTCHRHHTRR